ncbi:sucrose-6-phosphate hydrolase [Clostridium sp. CTA-7]
MKKAQYIEAIKKSKMKYLEKVNNDKWRGKYHIMAPIGWINDPNGLCYFRGKYHVYYQYSPLDVNGGLKFWGHYSSKDFINWQEEEVALYPDSSFDRDGVYSGSALVKDNEVYFFYTGNVKNEGDHDYITTGREQNVVVVKSEDGINFSQKTVVLTNKDFPKNMSLHVRDPKVWEEDGIYYMILGARSLDDRGCMLIYTSKDLYNWKLYNTPISGDESMGYMWECPDFFKLNNKEILLFSPQGIMKDGYKYNNVYQSGYILKNIMDKNIKLTLKDFVEIDRGFDFYAPQSFEDNKGRRIIIGWMGVPDAEEHKNPTVESFWQHQLTIPREIKISNGKIIQQPIKELEMLRRDLIEKKEIDIKEEAILDFLNTNSYELEIELINNTDFEIAFRKNCKLIFKDNVLKLALGKSGYGRDERSVKIQEVKNIRVFSDNSSLEIFINDGEEVFTTRIYNDTVDRFLSIKVNGKINLRKWNL